MTRPAAEMEQSCPDAAARTHMCFIGSWAQWLENQPACPTAEFETESPKPWVIAAVTDQHELLPKAVPQQNRASAEVSCRCDSEARCGSSKIHQFVIAFLVNHMKNFNRFSSSIFGF